MNGRKTLERPWQVWHVEEPIRIGVSSCLLGAEVRYDGGHKLDHRISEVLGEFFEWVPVCPEVEIGLGVPRPPIRLVKGRTAPRLVEPESGEDLTERMESFCGIELVKVFGQDERPKRNGVGVFARTLIRRWPNLPVAEDEWLEDLDRRHYFFERVLRRYRIRVISACGLHAKLSPELDAAHRALLEKLRVES